MVGHAAKDWFLVSSLGAPPYEVVIHIHIVFLCQHVRVCAALQRQRRQRPPSPPAACHWLFPRRNSAVTADGERACLDTKPPSRQKWHIAEVSNAAGQTGVRAPAEFLSPPRRPFSIRELRSAY